MAESQPPAAELRGRSTTPPEPREKPIGELLGDLGDQLTTLIRQELALARAELAQKGREAGMGLGLIGAAAVIGLAALGSFTTFLIVIIAKALPLWGAALLVAGVMAAVAGLLALRGRDRLNRGAPPVPEQTLDTVKEDVAWAKTRAQSGRR
jgi:hypothetical protein